jgi:hypothetical protein
MEHGQKPVGLAVGLALAGALLAAVLGVLTVGVQATAAPRGLPLAVTAPSGTPLRAAAERIAGQGGGQVSWRVADPAEGRRLLDDKEIYGLLELAPGPPAARPQISTTIVLSGAVNPAGTQVAQQVLTQVTQAATAMAAGLGADVKPSAPVMLHPASGAARTAPLAASALLWIGGLVPGVLLVVLAARQRRPIGAGTRLVLASTASLLGVGVVAGLYALWDPSIPLDPHILGFLLLTAFAFATLQSGLLRLLGVRAVALLAPLYLVAPSVAGQVPELLHEAYRVGLWSWSPFRFSTEGLRSLLQDTPSAPDVRTALFVLGGLAVVGLLLILWPGRRVVSPPGN